jgi:hypothetical protein
VRDANPENVNNAVADISARIAPPLANPAHP